MSQLNSLEFLVFLVAVATVAARPVGRWRPLAVLAASFAFAICSGNEYVVLGLAAYAGVAFAAGRWIQRLSRGPARTAVLVASLAMVWSVAVLSARYDWLMALGAGLEDLPGAEQLHLRSAIVAWASRVGVSFLALRASSYLVDSLFREQRLGVVSLLAYLFYFPAFLAGPVDRPWSFRDKLEAWRHPSRGEVLGGADRMLTGLVKKFVVADMLYPFTLGATAVEYAGWWTLAGGALAFSFYIYWEFSGYTDIVLGASRTLGIALPENFDRPYLKTDLSAFWRSWHISFSDWLREYLFGPLNLRLARAGLSPLGAAVPSLVVTMALCGVWHGYTPGYLLWGLHHGVGLSCHRAYQTLAPRALGRSRYRELSRRRDYQFAGWLGTFGYVTLGWVWFALPAELAVGTFLRLVGAT